MEISESMLEAAMRKAVDAGLFARRCTPDEAATNREIMRAVLQAAIVAAAEECADVVSGSDAMKIWLRAMLSEHDCRSAGSNG